MSDKLEFIKFKYSLFRDKLLLWSAGMSGSFFAFFKMNNIIADTMLIIAFTFSLFGFLYNLHKIGKIQKEIEKE